MKQLITLCACCLLLCTCNDQKTESSKKDNISFELQIVDSLIVDYLGTAQMTDISPDKKKYLLYDNQFKKFLVIDKRGQLLNEFDKAGDVPDNPATVYDNPAFINNNEIIVNATKGIFVYTIDGDLKWKIDNPLSASISISRTNTRGTYILPDSRKISLANLEHLSSHPSSDTFYTDFHAIKILDLESKTIDRAIPHLENSRFMDGMGHGYFDVLPFIHYRAGKMSLVFPQEPIIYLYTWNKRQFILEDTIALNAAVFHVDQPKERSSFKKDQGFSFGDKVGGANLSSAILLADDRILVKYNSGLKESERQKPELVQTAEGSFTLKMPDNIPPDVWVIFEGNQRISKEFNQIQRLGAFMLAENDFLWFSKNYEGLDEEDDYTVYYKVKVKELE